MHTSSRRLPLPRKPHTTNNTNSSPQPRTTVVIGGMEVHWYERLSKRLCSWVGGGEDGADDLGSAGEQPETAGGTGAVTVAVVFMDVIKYQVPLSRAVNETRAIATIPSPLPVLGFLSFPLFPFLSVSLPLPLCPVSPSVFLFLFLISIPILIRISTVFHLFILTALPYPMSQFPDPNTALPFTCRLIKAFCSFFGGLDPS